MHTNLEKVDYSQIVNIISSLSIIVTFFLTLVMALWEKLPTFFQLVLMIHTHTHKYSDDGMYMIGWDIEICFPSLKLYTIYVEWIAYFQKRAGENEQTENKTIECLKWLTKLSWKYCVRVCPVCMKLALKEKCHPSPSPFTSKWFSIELSLIYFTLRHEVLP